MTEEKDLSQEVLLDTLRGLVNKVVQQGIDSMQITKRPGPEGVGEYWTVEFVVANEQGDPPSTFVPAEVPTKPS